MDQPPTRRIAHGDQVLVAESGGAGDEHGDFVERAPVEVSKYRVGLGEHVERAGAGCLLAGGQVDVVTEPTGGGEPSVDQRQLAGDEQQVPTDAAGLVKGGWRRSRQREGGRG